MKIHSAYLALVILIFIGLAWYFAKPQLPIPQTPQKPSPIPEEQFVAPMDGALTRITKKPFGIYITPKNSPVQPERFTGYHAGVDFETTAEEQEQDVQVYAICTGPLLLARVATGYGGVAVQGCSAQNVTVVYGHVKLASIPNVGTMLKAGDTVGLLGKAYSSETSGERKHLHLGIHRGSAVNLRGYVRTKEELSAWMDIKEFLK